MKYDKNLSRFTIEKQPILTIDTDSDLGFIFCDNVEAKERNYFLLEDGHITQETFDEVEKRIEKMEDAEIAFFNGSLIFKENSEYKDMLNKVIDKNNTILSLCRDEELLITALLSKKQGTDFIENFEYFKSKLTYKDFQKCINIKNSLFFDEEKKYDYYNFRKNYYNYSQEILTSYNFILDTIKMEKISITLS